MKTYSRETYLAAQEAWRDGHFGHIWDDIRQLAAENGFIYPPPGTGEDEPNSSYRNIIFRALTDNPTETRTIVRESRSWSDVVDGIFRMNLRLALEAADTDAEEAEAQRLRNARDRSSSVLTGLNRILATDVYPGDAGGIPRVEPSRVYGAGHRQLPRRGPQRLGELLGAFDSGPHQGRAQAGAASHERHRTPGSPVSGAHRRRTESRVPVEHSQPPEDSRVSEERL